MPSKRSVPIGAIALVVFLTAPAANAQGVEVMPFSGFRLGGDFFELATGHPADQDVSPALGFVVNVPISYDLQLEAMVTQQRVRIPVETLFGAHAFHRVTVGHAQVGGLRELTGGRVRPFLTGVLGFTRYATDGDSEVRFSIGAGGGVKLFPVSRVGVRLDGRLFTTFVDADMKFLACTTGTCVTRLHVDVAWQAELSAGIVFRLQ